MKYLGRKIFLKDGGSHWCQQLVLDFYNCHCCVFWCQQWVYLGKWIECSIMSINSILGGCSCHDVTRWFAKSCYKASRSGCLMSPAWNWISGMDPTMNPLVLSASVEGSWTSWFMKTFHLSSQGHLQLWNLIGGPRYLTLWGGVGPPVHHQRLFCLLLTFIDLWSPCCCLLQ